MCLLICAWKPINVPNLPDYALCFPIESPVGMPRRQDQDHYRENLIVLCCQESVLHFEKCFSPQIFPCFAPLDKGSYSAVLRTAGTAIGQDFVLKMIKLKCPKSIKESEIVESNETSQLLAEQYSNVFQEVVVAKSLSNFHATICSSQGHEYRAHCFPKVFRSSLVNGSVPFESGPIYVGKQEFAAICMEDCGQTLRSCYKSLSLKQIASVCYQVLLGLAAAEAVFEYEHRDLHLGNIMVRCTSRRSLDFVVASHKYRLDTEGKRAFIIDNTFARMRFGEEYYYTNLTDRLTTMAKDADDATKSQSDQDRVYVGMFHAAAGNWAKWMPRSNLHWMNFLMRRMLKVAKVDSDEDKHILAELNFVRRLVESSQELKDVISLLRK